MVDISEMSSPGLDVVGRIAGIVRFGRCMDIGQSKVKTGNKLSPAGSTKSSPGLDVIGRRAGTVQAGQTWANLFLPTVRPDFQEKPITLISKSNHG